MKRVSARNVIDHFGLKIENHKHADVDRKIVGYSTHRAGLELAGFDDSYPYKNTVISWGTKEAKFLESVDNEHRIKAINNVINQDVPLLLLSKGFKNNCEDVYNLVLETANQMGVPIFIFKGHLATITNEINVFLIQRNTEAKSIHASLVIVNGVGVMIQGRSGIGKSEAVLELIQKGHSFVSDDTVEAVRLGNKIIGRPAKITKGLLEARGIGIINIPFIYGARAVKEEVQVELVIELLDSQELNNVDRLGNAQLKENVNNVELPKIQIPTASGRSVAALIEAATNVYLARQAGMDPLGLMEGRVK